MAARKQTGMTTSQYNKAGGLPNSLFFKDKPPSSLIKIPSRKEGRIRVWRSPNSIPEICPSHSWKKR